MDNSTDIPSDIDDSRVGQTNSGGIKSTHRQLSLLATSALTPNPRNPRKHKREQTRAIARSMDAFGFTQPILIDKNRQIVAGHGRYEAAKLLGLEQVPVIFLDDLTEPQVQAYTLADNALSDRSERRTPSEGAFRHGPRFRYRGHRFYRPRVGFPYPVAR